jgi:hypothetical protein
VPPLVSRVPSLPPEIADAIDRAVALDPGARPTAAELADALAGAASSPGARPVATPPAVRWKPWAIGGGAVVLVIALVAGTRGGSGGPSAPSSAPITTPAPVDPPPSELRITPPPFRDGKAEKDFRKVLDQIGKGRIEEAKKKLAEWERKHGATPETDALREQLEAMPEQPGGPRDRRDDD